MSYTVKSSEQHRKAASDTETKALLYLMNYHADKDEIHYFVVDFFNDLTGMDRFSKRLWDVQSKGAKHNTAKELGRELVTLLKNYLSSFDFESYILFVGGITNTFRINNSIDIFGIENVNERAKISLLQGLKEEAEKKSYTKDYAITDDTFNSFLDEVCFVVDTKQPSEYVRAIIQEHPAIIPDDDTLISIFEEIKQKQSSKKDASNVEGVEINTPDEALTFCRHITTNELKMLTLQRILHRNPLEQGIPIPFLTVIEKSTQKGKEEICQECQATMCRALFNVNTTQEFWTLFETVYTLICAHPNENVQEVYNRMDEQILRLIQDFDTLSMKYFIATIKDGIRN